MWLLLTFSVLSAVFGQTIDTTEDTLVSYKPEDFPMTRIALGGYTTLIQTSPTEVHQWGIDHGQKVLTFPEPINSLSCGGYHCLALSEAGLVYEWGQSDSSTEKQPLPVPVPELVGQRIVKIAAGFRHNVAINEEGETFLWGETLNGKVAQEQRTEHHIIPTRLEDVPVMVDASCGGDHTLLLDADRFIWSLGSNTDGQLGRNSFSTSCYTPMSVSGYHLKTLQMSAGGDHTLLLSEDSNVYSFGWGAKGQLGHGSTVNAVTPQRVTIPLGEVPVQVAAGAYGHSLILTANGNVYSFGINDFRQLGFDTDGEPVLAPTKIEGLPKVKEILGGGFKHSAVITESGELIVFGDNSFGQLGPKFLTVNEKWTQTLEGLNLI